MMAGNPSWWNMHLHPPSTSVFPQYVVGSPPPLLDNLEFPQSWSQLLMGGFTGEEERYDGPSHFQLRKLENWENQILNPSLRALSVVEVKQEVTQHGNLYGHHHVNGEIQIQTRPPPPAAAAWSQLMAVSSPSPRSCITSSSSNMLDFSYNNVSTADVSNSDTQPPLDQSSECNSKGSTGRVWKKARVQLQPSSSQPPLKVRKEKLGDRITALHQLVSPFGKTDTASVLLEVIGYIRFLQSQIEVLSSPYSGTATPNMGNQQSVQGEKNCAFPEDEVQEKQDQKPKDLRGRGLCLVPISCTQQVGSDNGPITGRRRLSATVFKYIC